jgi:hypothetical protein
MRATNGPVRDCNIRQIAGSAAMKASAISPPRRLPAVRTNTRAPLARSAAISSGRFQPLIFREHDPASLTDGFEPDAVLLVASEMIIVNYNRQSGLGQFSSEGVYAKRPIDEENTPIRRLRIGWLLRFH